MVAERLIEDSKPQHLANKAWAFAMASCTDAELFAAVTKAVEWRAGKFSIRDFANTA